MWETITSEKIRCLYHGSNSDFEMLEQFIKVNGFNKLHLFSVTPDIKAVLKSGGFHRSLCDKWGVRDEDIPPYKDHAAYFKNTKDKVCCLTYNPYYPADKIRLEVEQWATERGLKATVYDAKYSWYYPNSTCFVIISLPDVEIKLKTD